MQHVDDMSDLVQVLFVNLEPEVQSACRFVAYLFAGRGVDVAGWGADYLNGT